MTVIDTVAGQAALFARYKAVDKDFIPFRSEFPSGEDLAHIADKNNAASVRRDPGMLLVEWVVRDTPNHPSLEIHEPDLSSARVGGIFIDDGNQIRRPGDPAPFGRDGFQVNASRKGQQDCDQNQPGHNFCFYQLPPLL